MTRTSKNISRQTYTKEFKLSVVYRMLRSSKPSDVYNELGLARQTAHRWLNDFKARGESAFDEKPLIPGDELKALRKQLEDCRMENEILKKAQAYFAARNKKG